MTKGQVNRIRRLLLGSAICFWSLFFAQPVLSQNSEDGPLSKTQVDETKNLTIRESSHQDIISIALSIQESSDISLTLVDLKGRKVEESQRDIRLNPGEVILKYPVFEIKRGSYLLLVKINGYVHSRIVKIRK